MKKILVFLILLMIAPFVGAQFSSVMAEDPAYGGDAYTVVRRLSNSEVITYVHGIGLHRFTYENSSTLSYNYIDLPSPSFDNIRLNDFRIIDNVLYFCGENLALGHGVLGSFKTTYLLGPLGTTAQIVFADVSTVSTLFRMDAYIDPATGNPRLSVVGSDRISSCGPWVCSVWVDCPDFSPGATVASYSVYQSYSALPFDIEHWSDVVSTDNWVVLVGSGFYGGQEGLFLRRFPKGDPSDPEINIVYFYPESEHLIEEEVRALFLEKDDIAVAYRGPRINNVTDYTKFRVFRIGSMDNISSQEYVVPDKCLINEMAYMKRAGRVVLASDFPSPDQMSNFVYLLPYQSTPYPTVYVHDKDWRFWSVTDLDGYYFVGAGCLHFLMRDASAPYPAGNDFSSIPLLCPEDQRLNVAIIENIEFNKFSHNPFGSPYYLWIFNNVSLVGNRSLFFKCFSE